MTNKQKFLVAFIATMTASTLAEAGSVTNIYQDGQYTIVQCSVGSDYKIYRDSYGKCHSAGEIGGSDCSYVLDRVKWSCTRR